MQFTHHLYNSLRGNVRSIALASIMATTGVFSHSLQASVIDANSEAYGLGFSLSALNQTLELDLQISTATAGIAPLPTNMQSTLLGEDIPLEANLNVLDQLDIQLATLADVSVLTANATATNLTTTPVVTANSSVSNLGLSLFNTQFTDMFAQLSSDSALGLSSSTLYAEAAVNGDYGSLTATGNSYIQDLSVNLFGLGELDLDALGLVADSTGIVAVSPNFTVINLGGIVGLNLLLNEQNSSCSASACAMEVNALRLSFDSVDVASFGLPLNSLVSGSIDGDIVIGHASAAMQVSASDVPAPASIALLGLALAFWVARQRAAR